MTKKTSTSIIPELEDKLDDLTREIENLKSDMATSSEIDGVNSNINDLEKKILRRINEVEENIIGWLINNS